MTVTVPRARRAWRRRRAAWLRRHFEAALADGHSVEEVARRLGMTPETAERLLEGRGLPTPRTGR